MCMRASGASELRQFWHFTFLNCYFFQYFVIINAFSFDHLWYDAIYKRQYTDKTLTLRKCMYMRASLENLAFSHSKLLFPSIFLLVLHILCLRNIFNFRCQITSAYIIQSMQFPFITYGIVLYINDSIPTNTIIEQMYVYASELRKCWHFTFLNWYFFQYFVGTSDTLSVQMTCLLAYMYQQISKSTNKFSNVPTKLRKSIIGGGGGQLPPCHPPPPPPPPPWLR